MSNVLKTICLGFLASGAGLAADDVRVRYVDPTARMSLTLRQDITVVRTHPITARRELGFDLAFARGDKAAVQTTIDAAKGTYEAHGREMRLGTRHVTGKSFALELADGRRVETVEAAGAPRIDLGPPVTTAFSVAELLADTLPELPGDAVSVGTTWETERTIRCLEGWVWNTGTLHSIHHVRAVERKRGRTVVTVATQAAATLRPIEGEKPARGTLERTLEWTFDATSGRILTLSMEQDTDNTTTVPQGEIHVRQRTTVELMPRS